MSKRDYNRPLPKPPGCDPTNPEHVRSATIAGKMRATNENKANRRRYEKALHRFNRFAVRHLSLQLFEIYDLTPPAEPTRVEPYPAAFMLAQRQRAREACAESSRRMHELQMKHSRERLCEIVDIVGVKEFGRIMREVFAKEHPNIENRIGVALLGVKRRRDTPFTGHMDIVLALMEQRGGENLTACELHAQAGDGMTRDEIWQAMHTLELIDLLKPRIGRKCAVCDRPSEATFSAANID